VKDQIEIPRDEKQSGSQTYFRMDGRKNQRPLFAVLTALVIQRYLEYHLKKQEIDLSTEVI
jgi:hypothetical protein